MPARLRPINSLQHSPKQCQRHRKSVSMAIAGLASRRRSSQRTSYRMSSRAEKLLDDGDQSDGDSCRTEAENSRRKIVENTSNIQGGIYTDDNSSTCTPREEKIATIRGNNWIANDASYTSEATFPDDESPPKVEPKKIDLAEHPPTKTGIQIDAKIIIKEQDEIRAGNEALLFIWGHNANLYEDIFQLSTAATNRDITNSYHIQMSQLTVALDAMDYSNEASQEQTALVCGMKSEHLGLLHPKNFIEIKMDAVRRAYDILMEETSRAEYDELWKEFAENGDQNTVETMPETLTGTSDEFAEVCFWGSSTFEQQEAVSEELNKYTHRNLENANCHLEAGDIAYGSHGTYSYNYVECDDNNPARANNGNEDPQCCHYEGYDGHHREEEDICSSPSKIEHSFHGDEYKEFGDASFSLSPKDPMEFDLQDLDHFNQSTHDVKPKNRTIQTESVFDPFDLNESDNLSSATSFSFPEAAVIDEEDSPSLKHARSIESVSFVCKLPPRDVDKDKDELLVRDVMKNQPSTGGAIDQKYALIDMSMNSVVVSDLGSVSTSSESQFSVSTNDSSSVAGSYDPKKVGEGLKYKIRHMVASVSSSVSGRSSKVSSAASNALSVKVNVCQRGVKNDGESIVSHLTEENEEQINQHVQELDGMGRFDHFDITGNDGDARMVFDCQGFHVDDSSARSMGAEPDGPNMSNEDADQEEIETFLSIASTFHAMNAINKKVNCEQEGGEGKEILVQSKASCCDELSQCSNVNEGPVSKVANESNDDAEAKLSNVDDAADGILDCFTDDEEDIEYVSRSTASNFFDACIDNIDDTLNHICM